MHYQAYCALSRVLSKIKGIVHYISLYYIRVLIFASIKGALPICSPLSMYLIVTVNVLCTIIKVRQYPGAAQVCEVLYQGGGEGVPL